MEIDFCLTKMNDGSVRFSVSGNVWNSKHTDIVMGGQCLDDEAFLQLETKSRLFKTIKELWQKHHLNDLHAGTLEQEEALRAAYQKCKESRKFDILPQVYDYTQACEYLKSIGLYEVEHKGKPYRYGSGWIYYPR